MGAASYAKAALVRHLTERLPAELAARDARRAARVVCPPGPYVLEEGSTLVVDGQSYDLPAGEHNAAALTDVLEEHGLRSRADADGRLIILAAAPPSEGRTSHLEVGAGTANAALGIHPQQRVAIPLSSPPVRIYPYGPQVGRVDLTGPTICLDEAQIRPERERESAIVRVRLEVFFPGPQAEDEATVHAVSDFVAAIDAVIAKGDDRGQHMIGGAAAWRILRCFPLPWRVRDHVWQLTDGRVPRPFGRAQPEYEIRVWEPPGLVEE